jgi:hypothetical protein
MEGPHYYDPWCHALVTPTAVYTDLQQQLAFNSQCSCPELSQTQVINQMALTGHQDEGSLDAILQQMADIENLVPNTAVSGPSGYHLCHQVPELSISPATVGKQLPLLSTVKQRKPSSIAKKRSKQKDRDTFKRNCDEVTFRTFFTLFGPRFESDHQEMTQLYTKAEEADYVMHVSQAIFETLQGWPKENQSAINAFVEKVQSKVKQRQIEPEMKRKKSKTCKQRGVNKQDWCPHCKVPRKRRACLKKGKMA